MESRMELKDRESFTLEDVIALYTRGNKSLAVQHTRFRSNFIIFLKKSFRKNKEYIFNVFTETIFTLLNYCPNQITLLREYLILMKRFKFSSSLGEKEREILGQQTSYTHLLEQSINNFIDDRIDKTNPLEEMINDYNLSIVVTELIKMTWLVLKNNIQTRKLFNRFGKMKQLNSSESFWLTYYKFEKTTKNFTKLNKFINNLGRKILLPTATINDILVDYRSFYLLNSNLNDYCDTLLLTESLQDEKLVDPILYSQFKINDPQWIRTEYSDMLPIDWYKTQIFQENGHPGLPLVRPQIANTIIEKDSKSFGQKPPSLPLFRNLEKINKQNKYKDIFTEEYVNTM